MCSQLSAGCTQLHSWRDRSELPQPHCLVTSQAELREVSPWEAEGLASDAQNTFLRCALPAKSPTGAGRESLSPPLPAQDLIDLPAWLSPHLIQKAPGASSVPCERPSSESPATSSPRNTAHYGWHQVLTSTCPLRSLEQPWEVGCTDIHVVCLSKLRPREVK